MLFKQHGVIHKVGKGLEVEVEDYVVKVEVNQKKATPLRISARIKTAKVTGPTGRNLLIVTNINYEKTSGDW